jgi:DNA-binding NarL/FixJ family response regulator
MTYIALVDDHALLRSSLGVIINTLDEYKVVFEADNGKDFISQLNPRALPDIVMLDITMPEMNGYETAGWLKDNHPGIKVLVLSMLDTDTAIIKMLRAGARGFMLKDTKPKLLRSILDDIRDKGFHYNDMVSGRIVKYISSGESHAGHGLLPVDLSERENEFLQNCCSEKTYTEIAGLMYVSPRTVENYRNALFEKLQVTSRVGLVMYAIRNGIVKI